MPPAQSWSITAARRPRLRSPGFRHGEWSARLHEFFPRWDAFFPTWNDYDVSGTVVWIATFPFLSRLPNLFLTWPFAHISASGGEAGPRPSVEVVIFFQAALGSGHVVGRLLAPHPLAGPSFPRHILSFCRYALAACALGRFTPMGWTA